MPDGDHPIIERAKRLVRDPQGPLTRDLLRSPGGFGLGQVPTRLKPDSTTTMTCGFCATGCSLNVHMKDGKAVNLSPSTEYPVNLGMACPKGWEALTPLSAPDRATTPMVRDGSGKLRPVDWPTALRSFSNNMKSIQDKYGKDSVAFLSTGQIPFEEMAFLGALAKFGMGMLHGDGNTRQCMATAVVAYKQAFGFDAPPYTYADFEESDVLVFVGANPCIAHPIMWERVCRNPHDPTVIVMDPRRTETAQQASIHVPLEPKSDLYLLYAIAHALVRNGWIDEAFVEAHCEDFAGFAKHVQNYAPSAVTERTGIPEAQIERLAKTIHEGKRVSFWWTMGVNQSHEGVRTAQAIINLALMTGNIGRPGTGANSITGQCNAMGSRLFSNTTNLLGGHAFENAEHREKVANVLDIDVAAIPQEGSWAYDQILEGVLRGKIKGLWIIATNTAHSWINQSDAREVLNQLDFLVVQDMYHSTDTADFADLVLPAAGWGEKEGCFINSERRIGLIKQVAEAPGQALSDFRIFQLLAEEWGCGDMFRSWTSPEAVFQILKECSRDMPCDISGVADYHMIDELGGVQWPLPEGQAAERMSERRLFEDGVFFTANGKAKFLYDPPAPVPEAADGNYPMTLLTGRGSSSQWHTQTRTSKSKVLRSLYPNEPYIEISPVDAKRFGIERNDWVVVRSRRGQAEARAFISHVVRPGQVFMPMHYASTNRLTFPAFDPHSRQPSYKACAVQIERLAAHAS
jgi:anaerobic selenocysteine-containing dehydrogenase